MHIYLPVSLGEALDKLTILDIKLKFIKQETRLIEVKKEFDILQEQLSQYLDKCKIHYNLLKKVNLNLWHILDEQRDNTITEQRYSEIARQVVEQNDARFRAKHKINTFCNSQLKEQKGYAYTSVFSMSIDGYNLNSTNLDKVLENVLEKSIYYDNLEIVVTNANTFTTQLVNFFEYDNTIQFK